VSGSSQSLRVLIQSKDQLICHQVSTKTDIHQLPVIRLNVNHYIGVFELDEQSIDKVLQYSRLQRFVFPRFFIQQGYIAEQHKMQWPRQFLIHLSKGFLCRGETMRLDNGGLHGPMVPICKPGTGGINACCQVCKLKIGVHHGETVIQLQKNSLLPLCSKQSGRIQGHGGSADTVPGPHE
jgi:hypothetical protein